MRVTQALTVSPAGDTVYASTMHTSIDKCPAYKAVNKGPSRQVVAIRCTKCGAEEQGSDKPIAPIDVIGKHFARRGWRVHGDGKSATCPTCQHEGGPRPSGDDADEAVALAACEAQRKRQEAQKNMANTPTTPTTTMTNGETIKAQAKMHRLLDDHFDGERGTYDADWDDARVARESGLAVTEVGRTRDVAYGRLVDAAALAATDAIKAERARCAKEFSDMREMVDALERLTSERLDTLAAQVEALSNRKPRQ